MINIDKSISNPDLVKIMNDVNSDILKEDYDFIQELKQAKFLCPVQLYGNKDNYGKILLENNKEVLLYNITDVDNKSFFIAFTDWEEFFKWGNNIGNPKSLILSYVDYLKLLDDTNTIQKGESVMLGLPKDYPRDMVEKLKRYFEETNIVSEAYLLWMVRGEEASYLLVLDSKKAPHEVFPQVGEFCQPYLNGKLLDMIPLSSSFGKNAIENQKSFYQK